ncbi:MAG: hypothetical protein KGL29_09305 [Alphaproteobacteria bacterium]|nr:hypothetical protein [Alphaproteobacteria bacterium]MDE2266083.1 hypothetical protein [Alphaproteobacteria bacterium]MDE2500468.1 hypothetical protein [Alphaproteobacteria bacterium]
MRESFKKVSAGLLTLAVLGTVGGFLTMSLIDVQSKAATEVASMHATAPAIETVTVVGTRRAS